MEALEELESKCRASRLRIVRVMGRPRSMVKGTRITNGGSIQIEVISSATTAWAEKSFLTGSRRAQYSVLKRGVAERNGGA